MTAIEEKRAFRACHDVLIRLVGDAATADALVIYRDGHGAAGTAAILKTDPNGFGKPLPLTSHAKVLEALEAAHAAHVALDRAVAEAGSGRLQMLGREFSIDDGNGVIRFADGAKEAAPLVRCDLSAGPSKTPTRSRHRGRDRER